MDEQEFKVTVEMKGRVRLEVPEDELPDSVHGDTPVGRCLQGGGSGEWIRVVLALPDCQTWILS